MRKRNNPPSGLDLDALLASGRDAFDQGLPSLLEASVEDERQTLDALLASIASDTMTEAFIEQFTRDGHANLDALLNDLNQHHKRRYGVI
jgi:hypothetical protein